MTSRRSDPSWFSATFRAISSFSLLAALLVLAPIGCSQQEGRPAQPQQQASKLPIYELKMSPSDLRNLERSTHSDQTSPVTFIADGESFDSARVRYRGAWARSWPKKPLKIIFNDTNLFNGYDRINLNSCWRDASFVREHLAYQIYEACGVPAPKTSMVRLNMNGQFYGLYVEVEQPDKAFLKRIHLKGATLFKADSPGNHSDERDLGSEAAYRTHYEQETQKDEGYGSLQRFCRELERATNPLEFFNRNVDVEKYVNYLAATVLVQNWDGYNKNHYVLYDGKGSQKWFTVPWDLDRTLGDHWHGSFDHVELPIFMGTSQTPGVTGWNRLQDRFFKDPTLRARFLKRLRELLETQFTTEKWFPMLDQLEAQLGPDATLDRRRWPGPASDFRSGIAEVKNYIQRRRAFLLKELGKP